MVRQACACTVAVDLLPDLLEVAEERGRVLDVAVLVRVAGHAALAVEVLALKRGLDLAAQDVVPLVETRCLCAYLCAHAGVERGLAGGGDVGGEGGVGELAGELRRDLLGSAAEGCTPVELEGIEPE